jgi:hypothetical protein
MRHSTYIAFYEDGRSTFSELAVYFGSVPSEHLDTLDERFKVALQKIVADGLDMDRMSSVIIRDRLKVCSFQTGITEALTSFCSSEVPLRTVVAMSSPMSSSTTSSMATRREATWKAAWRNTTKF